MLSEVMVTVFKIFLVMQIKTNGQRSWNCLSFDAHIGGRQELDGKNRSKTKQRLYDEILLRNGYCHIFKFYSGKHGIQYVQ